MVVSHLKLNETVGHVDVVEDDDVITMVEDDDVITMMGAFIGDRHVVCQYFIFNNM